MIHFFNPGHETAVWNNSPYYMPPKILLKMHSDLAYLPAWYAYSNDFIFVETKPDNNFYKPIESLQLPQAINQYDFILQKEKLINEKIECWGISQAAIHQFETYNQLYGLRLGLPVWNEAYRMLCNRLQAQDCLKFLIKQIPEIDPCIVPQLHESVNSLEQQLSKYPGNYLAKALYSSSGQGLIWLQGEKLTQSARQIIQGKIKKQGGISLEKVVDKAIDFAMEFSIEKNGQPKFIGYSLFQTTNRGSYSGNRLASQQVIEEKIGTYIKPILLKQTQLCILNYLQEHVSHVYKGMVGIDMMVYQKSETSTMSLHPCVEINMRRNMGILSLMLYKQYLSNDATGIFSIDYSSAHGMLLQKDLEMKERFPLTIEANRIQSGYLSLCPVNANSSYRASVLVTPSFLQK